MEVNECYVCNDDKIDILLSNICGCKDRYIHKSCLTKLIDVVEYNNTCSVCKSTYKNVEIKKKLVPNKKFIFIFSILNGLFLFSMALFLKKVYLIYFDLMFMKTGTNCEPEANSTDTNVYQMKCSNFFINIFYDRYLALYIGLVFINICSLIRIYKIYKNKLFVLKTKCVYTLDNPDIFLSRCESVPC